MGDDSTKQLTKGKIIMFNNTSSSTSYTATFNPEAHITLSRNRLKKYGDKYFLKDGQQFEIELKNPTSNRILVHIEMNGKRISESGLVLPSSNISHYIERYIDEAKKFKFKTFMVDDVEATEGARERNGLVKVEFFNEKLPTYYHYPLNSTGGNIRYKTNVSDTYGGGYVTNTTTDLKTRGITYTTAGINTSFDISSMYVASFSEPEQVETGRIAQGGKSSQKFSTTTGDFYDTPFHTIEFQLLPESAKPVEVSEIRNYCSECGLRVRKSSWKYCPNCGERL
jgi:hypothetical protein